MNELRAAEASSFFDLKTASDQRGFVADPLSSDEFNYATGSASEDEDPHAVKAAAKSLDEFSIKVTSSTVSRNRSSTVSRNRFGLLSLDDDDCLDQFITKHGAIESLNADNSPEFNQSGDDKLVSFIQGSVKFCRLCWNMLSSRIMVCPSAFGEKGDQKDSC